LGQIQKKRNYTPKQRFLMSTMLRLQLYNTEKKPMIHTNKRPNTLIFQE
jgi:hypothetical protein